MNKYPVVIPYIKTPDHGQELRYTLRSLRNIQNFNGEVYIVGDQEKWFKNLHVIAHKRIYGKPYFEQASKMVTGAQYITDPHFIAMMDDVYITTPIEAKIYHGDTLPMVSHTPHQAAKVKTGEFLYSFDHTLIDYELHVPMLVNSNHLITSLKYITRSSPLQWRSIYGNINNIGGEYYKDKKTRTNELPEGKIISTNFFTHELDKLFPNASIYEK